MSKLKELILFENEQQLYQLEGNAYTDSPNPLVKLISSLIRLIWLIFGVKLRTYIVVTDRRIIRIDKKTIFWGLIPKDTVVTTLNKRNILSVGYAQAIRWFFFKTVYFSLEGMTEKLNITYKGSLKEIADIALKVSELVSE